MILFVLLIAKYGLVRDSNPGPLAPEAKIIPLDQRARCQKMADKDCSY